MSAWSGCFEVCPIAIVQLKLGDEQMQGKIYGATYHSTGNDFEL